MTDRDLELGRLQATAESLRAQNADQFRRIDLLEVATGKLEERVESLRSRLDVLGAPAAEGRRMPEFAYDWRLWVALVGLLGVLLGAWNLSDIRALIVPTVEVTP